jgi:hypothetical protein
LIKIENYLPSKYLSIFHREGKMGGNPMACVIGI